MTKFMLITGVQCRAARAGIGWSLRELAQKSGVDERTLLDFEQGTGEPLGNDRAVIKAILEDGGIRFTADGCICFRGVRNSAAEA